MKVLEYFWPYVLKYFYLVYNLLFQIFGGSDKGSARVREGDFNEDDTYGNPSSCSPVFASRTPVLLLPCVTDETGEAYRSTIGRILPERCL